MSGIAKVDASANEEMPPPLDPAEGLSEAMGTGGTEAVDSVVKTLAEAALKSMPGTMTDTAKEEMTQTVAAALRATRSGGVRGVSSPARPTGH